jgi:hypothetical protein
MIGLSLITCHYVKHGMNCTPGFWFLIYWVALIVLIFVAAWTSRP